MTAKTPPPDATGGLDKIFNQSPIDKEVPENIWETIRPTWTGLWTDAYGEWDEKQPSDLYPLSDLLSSEAEQRLKTAIEHYATAKAEEAAVEARINELERLDHNKQMFGDWQQVIADRIAELQAKQQNTDKQTPTRGWGP